VKERHGEREGVAGCDEDKDISVHGCDTGGNSRRCGEIFEASV
jgi:hypothetical protein